MVPMFGELERWMDEMMHRPLLGMGWLPGRSLLRDLTGSGEVACSVDMFEEGGCLVVKAEIPGMKREDVEVSLVDNTMVISGDKQWEDKVERQDYLRFERARGTFRRVLALPDGLDYDGVKASYRDGVLEVRIPRTEPTGAVRHVAVD